MTDRELLQQVLDAWQDHWVNDKQSALLETIRARLAQPEPEPVAWAWVVNSSAGYYTKGVGFDKTDIPFAKHIPLYATPPQREWQGLTAKDLAEIPPSCFEGAIWADAKLKEKNT